MRMPSSVWRVLGILLLAGGVFMIIDAFSVELFFGCLCAGVGFVLLRPWVTKGVNFIKYGFRGQQKR